jgi:hypothetical protein
MSTWKQDIVEILGTFKEQSGFGGEVLLHLNGEQLRVGFNVNERAYMLLKKLVSFQPFESVVAGKYRYFFAGSYRQTGEDTVMTGIQVVQDRRHKKFELELTQALLANLRWLQEISNKEQVEHLLRVRE